MKDVVSFLRCYKIVGTVFLSLTFSLAECMGTGRSSDAAEGAYGYVRDEDGSPIGEVDVSIFDGFTIHKVKTGDSGLYKIPEVPVSIDRYAVVFFTKDGYSPKAVNIRVSERKAIEYSAVMERTDVSDTGFIIGTVYQPVRGGKIQFQSGIYGFGKNRRVWLERDGESIENTTDMDGHFLFKVHAGGYKLSGEGSREKAEVKVSVGQTVIRNLRSGIVLID